MINPFTNIIQNISVGSTQIFVESVKTFFDSADEYLQDGTTEKPQKKIIIISQDQLVSAAATAVVSVAGTISSVVISDGGVGYTTNPSVIIENPVGLGTTQRATATSVISVGGTVSTISISSPGTGYTISSPPGVLIDSPKIVKEIVDNVSYEGDFGINIIRPIEKPKVKFNEIGGLEKQKEEIREIVRLQPLPASICFLRENERMYVLSTI